MIEQLTSKQITNQINIFRNFLVSAWPILEIAMENHDWDDDDWFIIEWIEANWIFFLERELLGSGKKLCPLFFSTNLPLKKIDNNFDFVILANIDHQILDQKTNTQINTKNPLRLDGFLSKIDDKKNINVFGYYPPFNYAKLIDHTNNKEYYALLDKTTFSLCRWKEYVSRGPEVF